MGRVEKTVWAGVFLLLTAGFFVGAMFGQSDGVRSVLTLTLVAVFAAGVYLLPTVVAVGRGAPDRGMVIVINLLLGVTVIGWAIAMALAFRDPRK